MVAYDIYICIDRARLPILLQYDKNDTRKRYCYIFSQYTEINKWDFHHVFRSQKLRYGFNGFWGSVIIIYISPSPILSYDGGWVCVGGWYPQNLWNMQFGGHKGFSHLFHHFNSFRPFTVSHFYLINSSGESMGWDGIWDVCFLFRRCCLWLLHFSNYVITLRSEVMDGWIDNRILILFIFTIEKLILEISLDTQYIYSSILTKLC